MKLCVSDIVESYKDTIMGYIFNACKLDLLLHIVQWCRACAVDKNKWDIYIVLYCTGMMYKYYSRLGFLPIKQYYNEVTLSESIESSYPTWKS